MGELEGDTACAEVENPACGDVMRLSLRVQGNTIVAARYRTKGCVASIACGSALTEWLMGRTLDEARKLAAADVAGLVGGLPPGSQHASHLTIDALAGALHKLS